MTIENSRTPSGGVVVIGSLSQATRERLVKAADGKIAKISDAPLTHVVEKTGVNLRKFSERINKVVGTEGVVAPMLADEEGNRLLPTGRMQVRFKEPPTDNFLTSFASGITLNLPNATSGPPSRSSSRFVRTTRVTSRTLRWS